MTTNALTLPRPADVARPFEELVDRARGYAADGRARSTRKAYLTDFATFEAWCTQHARVPMAASPVDVAVYLTALADQGRKPSTIERALTGIAHAHRSRGFEWPRAHPAISAVMEGIRRRAHVAPAQKTPVGEGELAALVKTFGTDAAGVRDRALVTLGWFGAFRRSELVALDVADVARAAEGVVLSVRRSKGDQQGRGATKGIAHASRVDLCAVRALDAWLTLAGIVEGPLFRAVGRYGHVRGERLSDRGVARIVKRAATRAGLDPTKLAGHSLRSGFATAAAKRGKSLDAIMRQTLHKSESVARGYIRHAQVFDDNATVGFL